MVQSDDQSGRYRKYKRMRLLRQLLAVGFVPSTILVLFLASGSLPWVPDIFAWPLLLLFALGCFVLAQLTDPCPWCGKSFHVPVDGTAVGLAGLLRRHCINCGEPFGAASHTER